MGLDTTRYEARRRVRGTLAMTALICVFALFIINVYPSIAQSSADIDALIQSFPEAVRQGVGIESYATIEGFLSTELYTFLWVLLLGLYMAYTAGGSFAGDIESGRLYLLLATPLSRTRIVLEKALALLTPLVVLDLVLPLVVFGGTLSVGYPVDLRYLLAVHALTLPYLLVCAGIGLVLSVTFDRGNVAQMGAIAVVFVSFLLDSVTAGTDFEWVGALSPARYVSPTDVLLHERLAVGDALLLLGVAALLLFASVLVFHYRDV